MGDNSCPPPPNQARGLHCLCELRVSRITLVHAVLLSNEPGAVLPECWRRHHHRMRADSSRRVNHEVVVSEEEQDPGGGGAGRWSAQGVEVCWLMVRFPFSVNVSEYGCDRESVSPWASTTVAFS